MFEDALLDSSLRRPPVLRRIHYSLSALAGTAVFVQSLHLLPSVLVITGLRALAIAAAVAAVATLCYALILCYVWVDARQQHLPVWPWLVAILVLNLAGFLLYLIYAAAKSGDWKRAAISLAYVAEAVMVGMMILVPLIYTQALPITFLVTEVHIPPPPGPPPAQAVTQRPKPVRHPTLDALQAPPRIPPNIQFIVEAPEPPQTGSITGEGVIGAPPGGLATGPMIAVLRSVPWGDAPPPPPETHTVRKVQPVHVGGKVIAAMALYQPRPDYPHLAMLARVQGTVVMQAIIGRDGTVQELKVVNGPPLLIKAAVEAVKTWRYQPTLLNGEPVDVITEISVNFTLAQ